MAFREVYGGQDKPKGKRYRFKEDMKRNVTVFLIIQPQDTEMRDEMNKLYADYKRDPRTKQRIATIPPTKDGDATKFLAWKCWADIENGWVVLQDKEAVEFYSKELNESFDIGAEVLLDGRMTDAIKKDFLSDDLPLANWIVVKATNAEEEEAAKEAEENQKNSQSSSSSNSEPTQTSPIRSVGNVS